MVPVFKVILEKKVTSALQEHKNIYLYVLHIYGFTFHI